VTTRRGWLLGALTTSATALTGCGNATRKPSSADPYPPVIFVHGNGDHAGLWITTIWRFESQGWPRDKLHAVDLPYPLARDDNTRAQPGRSSTDEQMRFLASEVQRVLRATGSEKVVLIGHSRGGYAIRSYIDHGGGDVRVSHAVLAGTPNHGVWADPRNRPGNEFNGAGPFLTALNAPKGASGQEVTPGVSWLTLRSDQQDKYAQPDGEWIGSKGRPTHIDHDGPALKGAQNIVLAGADHRETAFSAPAFAAMWRFLTGRDPTGIAIAPESRITLDGKVLGLGVNNDPAQGGEPSNLPLPGARVEVYATHPSTGERIGSAVHTKTLGADGRWGPFDARAGTPYEFVITAPGCAVTHVYRSPFLRSSSIVQLQAERVGMADRDARSIITLVRPRGFFGIPRDDISLDGMNPPGGIPPGVPAVSSARLKLLEPPGRAVAGAFNGEHIVGRAWPVAENRVVFLELHH
jgi:pimeloyl-ACP methyl ester carboxylesterase